MRFFPALLLLAAAALCIGCGPNNTNNANRPAGGPPAPDNSGVNVRDRQPDAPTPETQDNDEASVKIIAAIRQRIVGAEGMSVNGQNVKIIKTGNTITLRGPVASADEKSKIEQFAKEAAPDLKIVNALEIP